MARQRLTDGDAPWLDYEDKKITLVAAETTDGGLRVRIQRVDISSVDLTNAKNWSLNGGVLTLGNATMTYCAEGDAFRWE